MATYDKILPLGLNHLKCWILALPRIWLRFGSLEKFLVSHCQFFFCAVFTPFPMFFRSLMESCVVSPFFFSKLVFFFSVGYQFETFYHCQLLWRFWKRAIKESLRSAAPSFANGRRWNKFMASSLGPKLMDLSPRIIFKENEMWMPRPSFTIWCFDFG